MTDRLFPIFGGAVPSMRGREATLSKIFGALTKATPDHLQIVGPRFAGKTVILHELAKRLRDKDAPYDSVFVWDLGHQTPVSDDLFMQRFGQELASALDDRHSDYAQHLRSAQANIYQDIAEVLDALKEENSRVLAILDGFDKPLSNGKLTRNLWDQLRELALKSSIRLVTASRRTLRDLIRQPDAQTSDFWNIFEPSPIRVGCFDEDDLTELLAFMNGVQFTDGAKTELWNATNGFPILLLEVLNKIHEDVSAGQVTHTHVVNACRNVLPLVSGSIETLWGDCPPSSQDLVLRVIEERSVARAGISHGDTEVLVERGFVQHVGSKLQRPNGLLCKFLEDRPHEGNALVRLFGDADAYQKHFKGVMERRIAHLPGADPVLKRYLERGAEDLPKHPEVFLSNIRGIVNKAFELIWAAELEGKHIPSGWMSIWKRNQESRVDEWETKFPQGVHRVRLLNLMTGTDKSSPCARYVGKSTYVLMNAVHAFGDFGQHLEGAAIDPAMAYSVLLLCIELTAALARELPSH